MRFVKRAARFYARHPWSTALIVFWIASMICGARIATGGPLTFAAWDGSVGVSKYDGPVGSIAPTRLLWLPRLDDARNGWLTWPQWASDGGSFVIVLPAWILMIPPRLQRVFRDTYALLCCTGSPCTVCCYDITSGVLSCPECGATAPVSRPRNRTILLRELKTFVLLVAAPLAVMLVMEFISELS